MSSRKLTELQPYKYKLLGKKDRENFFLKNYSFK